MNAIAAKTIQANLSFNSNDGLYHLHFGAMGTDCRILFDCDDRQRAIAYARNVTQWVADFETKYTRFSDTSLISHIHRSAGVAAVDLDDSAESIFDICDAVYQSSDGILDVTALPIIALWDYRRADNQIPSDQEVSDTLELVGWPKVERRPGSIFLPRKGMCLDLGGWGKEFAVDEAWSIAKHNGIQNLLIDFGRDIRVAGAPPQASAWTIGLEDPFQLESARFTLHLNDAAVATSGNYRRNFTRQDTIYGHIVDPRNGRPAGKSALSATVIAATCLQAGTLSTTACVLGAECGAQEIENSFGARGCMIHQSKVLATKGFYEYAIEN